MKRRTIALPLICLMALQAGCAQLLPAPPQDMSVMRRAREGWDFGFDKFLIGAWWPGGMNKAQLDAYTAAGFNVIQYGRYEEPDGLIADMDLAQEYGLGVMFDTYTMQENPWGGQSHPAHAAGYHHHAYPGELRWLYEKIGRHPALVGFLLGDDQGGLPPEIVENTRFLQDKAPHLMPWVCQAFAAPQSLAWNRNPIFNPQMYAIHGGAEGDADAEAQGYLGMIASHRAGCLKYDLINWPIFNVAGVTSDSPARFQPYASIAYGAQGLWYFTYCYGLIAGPDGEPGGAISDAAELEAAKTPIYDVVADANRRIAFWGPEIMGRESAQLFSTGWPAAGAESPAKGRLVESMSEDLLAGVLTAPGRAPAVMVVDKRTSKTFGALPDRDVEVVFHPAVQGVRMLEEDREVATPGYLVRFHIQAGGGQLLLLDAADFTLPQGRAVLSSPLLVDTPPDAATGVSAWWTSYSNVPVAVQASVPADAGYRTAPALPSLVVGPGETARTRLTLTPGPGETLGSARFPLSLPWRGAHVLPRGDRIEISGEDHFVIAPTLACPYRERSPRVDGKLDDWYGLPHVCEDPALIKLDASTWKGPEDGCFRFATAWNEDGVFIAIAATDDEVSAQPGLPPWGQDGFEVRLDARCDPWRSHSDGGGEFFDFLLLGLSPVGEPADTLIYRPEFQPEGIQAVSVPSSEGHVAEIFVPASYLDEKQGGPWEYFRLNIAQSDHDGAETAGPGAAHLWWTVDWRMGGAQAGSGTFRRER